MSGHHETKRPPDTFMGTAIDRRRLFQGAALGAAGLAAVGIGGVGIAQARQREESIGTLAYAHPGTLHTQADFDRMAAKVAAGAQPWKAGWDRLVANSHSQSSWSPRPTEVILRGGGSGQNYHLLYHDTAAAYQNALRWKITGDTAHGDTARDICNAWSQTLESLDPTYSDSRLASGIYGYQFAVVGEIIRDYPGFDLGRFQGMMQDVFYPLNSDFLVRHNDTCDSHYWANWDLCNMASILAIGILRDDQAQFDEAIDYFWNGAGNGAIDHAIPFIHGDLAQWQETGRDQAHSIMGIGLMAEFMEMAWNQGVDLYSARDNAFAKAAEYVARYNLGNDVPYTTYSWGFGHNCEYREQTHIGSGGRGEVRPVWERVYNHYSVRRGMAMPNVAGMAGTVRPEGGGGDYGSSSGGFDTLGFGTLVSTLESSAAQIVSGGVYTLTCERSGKVLDNDSSTEDGHGVVQWSGNSGTQQRWRITDVGGGHYKLVSQFSGKALDNSNAAEEGRRVIQWADNGGTQQRWRITDVGGGAVKLTCERSGMVLDNGNTEGDGDEVVQWADNGGPQQRWRLHHIA